MRLVADETAAQRSIQVNGDKSPWNACPKPMSCGFTSSLKNRRKTLQLEQKMDSLNFNSLFLFLLFLLSLAGGSLSANVGLPCKAEGQTCSALVAFKTKSITNLSAIATVFQLSSYRQLLGANAWNLSLSKNTTLPKDLIVKVPISCGCNNGSGISQGGPFYTVQPDDTLSIIAETKFSGLLIYQDIVTENPVITDPDKIYVGQKFRIPLPCTCESNGSSAVVHYTYVVQAGSTLKGIATEMGTTQPELMRVNNITNASLLAAGETIDVPLKACSSNISKYSTDHNLFVANGSYAITANNCLQCSCGPSDQNLYCTRSPLAGTCSSMQCKNSNLVIGNITTQQTSGGCNVTECSYNGYVNKQFLTVLETSLQSQCPGKHVLPTLTTPRSTVLAPPPAAESPNNSPSPEISPSSGTSPSTGNSGSAGSPNNVSPPSKSMAADSLNSLSLVTMLVLGLPLLIHFGEW